MLIVSIARYRDITGDRSTPSVDVSAKIEHAQELLADALGRELAQDEYTETLWPTRDGYVWPSNVPIVSCDTHTIDGDGLRWGVTGSILVDPPFGASSGSFTYVGGWVERSANPAAANRLPAYIEADIAWAARALVDSGTASEFPAGATNVQLGDASVSFGADGAPANDAGAVKWSRRTLRHRNSTVRGAGAPR